MSLREEFDKQWRSRHEIDPEVRGTLEDYWVYEREQAISSFKISNLYLVKDKKAERPGFEVIDSFSL